MIMQLKIVLSKAEIERLLKEEDYEYEIDVGNYHFTEEIWITLVKAD